MTPYYQNYDHGITCIDTEQMRPGLAACYLLRSGERHAFVDCGTALSAPGILKVLAAKGVSAEQVDYVLPTHVHLDHAGGAGTLMRLFPNAQLVAHPRAARHLIDPAKLIEGATAVYGAQAVRAMYGEIVPAPESRLIVAPVDQEGGCRLDFNGRELLFLDAPGHARHHYVIWDAASRGLFSGDTFGISYREFDGPRGAFLIPTTTPVQFEPEAWLQTLDRLMALQPEQVYLTHYGRVGEVPRLVEDLRRELSAYQRIARQYADVPDRHARLVEALTAHTLHLAADHGSLGTEDARTLLRFDMELNAQGLEVWLDRSGAR